MALFSSDLSDAAQKRADIAIAMAEERLLETHVEHALKLIELTGNHIEFDEALDIYTRLLRLSADDARSITTQALARLGERGEPASWTAEKKPAEAKGPAPKAEAKPAAPKPEAKPAGETKAPALKAPAPAPAPEKKP